jgi:uncharacterized protein YyaL (SSP411 family)
VANRLAFEHSPYLLQHKDNPVDWFPWGDEAFEKARRGERPIFLSIGYSTCHWCHVMEHESFEHAQVAEALNRDFVSIKVDREERPDVDRVYMTFVQATTGSGGWPMSVWLTPDLRPFYGGTYFPPTSRWGRPGFLDILQEISRVWREERGKVLASASTIIERLERFGAQAGGTEVPGVDVLRAAVQQFWASFDSRRGGFGDAPKFPRPSELLFLLREHVRTGEPEPRDMVLATLRGMANGGMRDHLGGGFHRYSVDGDWRVPHFEKMLYDQAQLVLAYLEAAQLTGDPFYAAVAADTLDYVRRDLTDAEGGFYSAEDADSVPPEQASAPVPRKMEGAFYVWHDDEIVGALGEDADVFRLRFGVLPDGNAPSDPQQEFTHKNLLYVARSIEKVAGLTDRSPDEVSTTLERARATLLAVRHARPHPYLDDKVLTAWNGLMIAAFARAARVLEQGAPYLAVAQRAARFLRTRLWRETTLLRRFRRGDAGVNGYAEDYAYLVAGLLELFQADGDSAWLEWALALQRRQDELFWDPDGAGWFSTTGHDPSVLLRLKEDYDGAEPAASSVSVLNLLALSHLTGDPEMAGRVEQTLSAFSGRAGQMGRAVPMMLSALSTYHAGMPQLVVVGDPALPGTLALLDVMRTRYAPTALIVSVDPARRGVLDALMPWTAAMPCRHGRPTAYLCRDFRCDAPVTSPEDLAGML